MSKYRYYSDWKEYVFPESEGELSDSDDIKAKYKEQDMGHSEFKYGGLPMLVEGNIAYINDETEMTIIYGETGSGKTRKLIAPLICSLAKKKEESMVIMDVKGELSGGYLSSKIRGVLEDEGYNLIFLNFRDLNSDCYSILDLPYRYHQQGQTDKAMMEVSNIIEALASAAYDGTSADKFWKDTATAHLSSIAEFLLHTVPTREAYNTLTLASYTSQDAADNLKDIRMVLNQQKDSSVMIKLASLLSEPEKTRMSTFASAAALLRPFNDNPKLIRMLGKSTFDIADIYRKKTALIIILPDEVSTYNQIAGLIMHQISSFLVADAYKLGGKLPRRVNFIYDEFCNAVFGGNGEMGRALSAQRSRNIRYYLVCQGLGQLEKAYPKDKPTILTNCKNVYYLGSSDRELKKMISEESGISYENKKEMPVPIISVFDLDKLQKTWDYTECYIKSGNTQCISKLPDIDQYEYLKKYEGRQYSIPVKHQKEVEVYSPEDMLYDIEHHIKVVDFKREKTKIQTKEDLF